MLKVEVMLMAQERFILKYDELEIGDIVLETGYKPHSQIIQKVTNSHFSHAMICIEKKSLIHATKDGIFTQNPQRILVKNINDLKVLRLKNTLTQDKMIKLADFLRDKVGALYSVKEAMAVPFKKDRKAETESQFCSRLVAQSYNSVGYKLVKNVDYCSPEDINQSNQLVELKNMIRKASMEDIEYTKTKDLPLANQKSTYKWLNKTRNYAYSEFKYQITKQNDVEPFLLKHPVADNIVCKYLKDSGYLENYKIFFENNVYLCDKQKYIEKYNNILITYAICNDFKNTIGLTLRALKQCKSYELYYNKKELNFFKLNIELYKNILQANREVYAIFIDILLDTIKDNNISDKYKVVFLRNCIQCLVQEIDNFLMNDF